MRRLHDGEGKNEEKCSRAIRNLYDNSFGALEGDLVVVLDEINRD